MRHSWDVPKKEGKASSPRTNVDRAWAWVVLGATVFNTVITTGQVLSANIYFVIFLREFGTSRSFTAWIPAALSTMLCMAGPLSSQVVQRLGARPMIFLGSILLTACFLAMRFATSVPYLILVFAVIGIGHTFTMCGNLSAISTYFKKKAPVATGVTLAGAGIGSMLVGLEIEWAVETYGWRGATFLQAGLTLNMCVSGALIYTLRTPAAAAEPAPDGPEPGNADSNAVFVRDLVGDASFWLSVAAFLALNANLATVNAILKGMVISYDLESTFKTVIVTVGVGGIAGRLLAGPVSDRVPPPFHLFAASVSCSATVVGLVFARVPWSLAVATFAYGFTQGQMVVAWVLKIAWVFGLKKMPVVRGYVMFFGLLTSMSCPPLAGYTVDVTGNYDVALVMVASFSALSGVCGLLLFYIRRRKRREETTESQSGPDGGDADGTTVVVPVD